MIPSRIIPCLLLSGKGFVKTIQFKNPVYLGDPLNIINIYNKKMVDEIIILDVNATVKSMEPAYNLLQRISSICFSPLTYGGGVKSLQIADQLFGIGVEKVCLNSAAFQNPSLVSSLAKSYGNQSVVVSINIMTNSYGGKSMVDNKLKLINTNLSIGDQIQKFVSIGAGEILINDVTRDGTMKGYDIDFIQSITSNVSVPVIACGGCSSYTNLKEAIKAGAAGAAAGSVFVFNGPKRAVLISYPDRQTLKEI